MKCNCIVCNEPVIKGVGMTCNVRGYSAHGKCWLPLLPKPKASINPANAEDRKEYHEQVEQFTASYFSSKGLI